MPGPGDAKALFDHGVLPFAQPGTVFKRKVYEDLEGFDESFRFAADMDFFERTESRGCVLAKAPGGPVAAFRIHGGQFSKQRKVELAEETERIRKKRVKGTSAYERRRAYWAFLGRNLGNWFGKFLRRNAMKCGMTFGWDRENGIVRGRTGKGGDPEGPVEGTAG